MNHTLLDSNTESMRDKYLIVAFVNRKSGGQQGEKVLKLLGEIIGTKNVYPLETIEGHRPEDILKNLLGKNSSLRIIAAGGDGTAAWMFYALDKVDGLDRSCVAVLPLGTGNDMAGFLKWGYGGATITESYLRDFVKSVVCGQLVNIDRWNVSVSQLPGIVDTMNVDADKKLPYEVLNNYLCVGADAGMALRFHQQRHNDGRHTSWFTNRLQYIEQYLGSCLHKMAGPYESLDETIILECDGNNMKERLDYLKPDTILFLNIKSYAGGCKPWGSGKEFSLIPYHEKWAVNRSDDGLIEVIAYSIEEMADIMTGQRGHRLAQCRRACLTTMKALPMKVDGEPVLMAPCVIEIDWKNSATGLRNVVGGKYDHYHLQKMCGEEC
ncbi:hypothetical protein ACOME3_001546 [Neoechinorhynchus agilis]